MHFAWQPAQQDLIHFLCISAEWPRYLISIVFLTDDSFCETDGATEKTEPSLRHLFWRSHVYVPQNKSGCRCFILRCFI